MPNNDQDFFDDLIVRSHFHEDELASANNNNESEIESDAQYWPGLKCQDLNTLDSFGRNLCWPTLMPTTPSEQQVIEDKLKEMQQSLIKRHKEEEELRILMENDPCMAYEYGQKCELVDLPEDTLVQIFQFLTLDEVHLLARVSKLFRHICSKINLIFNLIFFKNMIHYGKNSMQINLFIMQNHVIWILILN